MFRRIRKRERIRVTGPATIIVEAGRASVTVEADKSVEIHHDKPSKAKVSLTRRRPLS
jgi:hypothetical protein